MFKEKIVSPRESELNNLTLVNIEQITTRGDEMNLGEDFKKTDIDFGSSVEHLNIHHGGAVAGSQFNETFFSDPAQVEDLIKKILPERLKYDQFNRSEITLEIATNNEEPIGWTGVKSIKEISEKYPKSVVRKEARMTGGEEATEDGINGNWYPETVRNPETGKFEVAKDANGNILNSKGKFEPKANIVEVDSEMFKNISGTNKITIIIQKNRETNKPEVLTIFPGENAPGFPCKINTENFKLDTLRGSKEDEFWSENAFIKTIKK